MMTPFARSLVLPVGGALLCAFARPAPAQSTPVQLVPEKSYIRFVSKQMNVPVEGRFRKFASTVVFDPKKPESTKAEFAVELASIDMESAEAEGEVRRKIWFNTDAFPKASFTAATVKSLGSDRFSITGPLTIKGTTLNITAQATVKTDTAGVTTVEGSFPLKRLPFKIGENQWADTDTVADDVEVRFKFLFHK